MRRSFAKLGLRLITAVTSVFIAACYGVTYLRLRVQVVDSGTQAAIPGISVGCLDSDGTLIEEGITAANGEFEFSGECVRVAAEDVDGAENGSYAARVVDSPYSPLVIPLEPVP
jgi:hypothetical protein